MTQQQKLSKLQLDYLRGKLSTIANKKLQYVVKPKCICGETKRALIAGKKVKALPLEQQLALSEYTYWYNIYDFSKQEAKYKKDYALYAEKVNKVNEAVTSILDKVILSGLNIEQALKDLEALEV